MKKYLLFYFFVLSLLCTSALNAQIEIDGLMFDWDESMRLDVEPNNTQGRSLFFDQGDPYTPSVLYGNPDANFKVNLDLGPVYAHDDANYFYIRSVLNPLANVATIPSDTSIHGGAGFMVFITVDPDSNVADTLTQKRVDSTGLGYGGTWCSAYDMFAQLYPADSAAEANTEGQQYMWQHNLQAEWGWSTMQESVADTTVGILVAWNANGNEVEAAIPKSIFANPKFMTAPSIQKGDSFGLYLKK